MDDRIAALEEQMLKINDFCAGLIKSGTGQVDALMKTDLRVDALNKDMINRLGRLDGDFTNLTNGLDVRIKALEETLRQMVQVQTRWQERLEARIRALDARLTALNGSVAQMLEFNENLKLRM